MLAFGIVLAFAAAANAGYASTSTGAGLYNSNSYGNQNYGSKYPYSSQYSGFSSGSAGGFPYYQPFAPIPQVASPFEFNNALQQYFQQLSAYNANLFQQQLAHQADFFNAIRNQAAYGGQGGYGPQQGGGAAYGGASAGSGAFAGGSTGSYGGIAPGGQTYGGTYGGGSYAPNFASSGGSVSSTGHQQGHASIYPANPVLDTRFGPDEGATVTQTAGAPGFVGISSFSSSSDINGQKHRESGTSINNNGKVTNYHTRN